MSPCCRSLTIFALAGLLSFFLGLVQATSDEAIKLGNNTIERTVQLRTHSIFPPYIDQDLQNRWWDFGANSYVNTNKHIRLTRPRPSQMGWLWSRLPLTATNWVIEVEFKVSGQSSHLYGDGLAVWLTTKRAEPGPVFGSVDKFMGLGIFLDTYANSRHSYSFPRITAMLGDGETLYDYGRDGDSQSIGACSADFRRTNVATKLKITYLKDKFIDVKIQYKAWDEWSSCFTVSPFTLPTAPFLGFSAMTGDVFDAHDIISVTTYSAVLSQPDAPLDKLKTVSHEFDESSSGSWFGFFVKLVLFGGLCAGAFYGYKHYTMRKGNRPAFGMRGGGFGGLYTSGKRF